VNNQLFVFSKKDKPVRNVQGWISEKLQSRPAGVKNNNSLGEISKSNFPALLALGKLLF
jgi:hypothetical protein